MKMNILNFGVGLEISSIPFFKYAGCSRSSLLADLSTLSGSRLV